MAKKAQGISINTIIIAAIGLAVLIVLFAIFTGRLGIFTKTVQDTDTCAQKCSSLNMDRGTPLDLQTSQCDRLGGEQTVPGTYSDSKFGCCCRPRS